MIPIFHEGVWNLYPEATIIPLDQTAHINKLNTKNYNLTNCVRIYTLAKFTSACNLD